MLDERDKCFVIYVFYSSATAIPRPAQFKQRLVMGLQTEVLG
jgi:hypothetical protein